MSDAAANPKLAQIIETVKALTVIELADLVHALEKEFGVSAAAVASGPAAAAAPVVDEAPTSFKVTLTSFGANKIAVIKVVREILGLGLADAKAFVEGVPKVIKEGLEKPAAEELAKKVKESGAEVKIEGT